MNLGGFPERIWRSRWIRLLFILAVFVLLATVTRPGPPVPPARPGWGVLRFEPVALNAGDQAAAQVGRLRYLGGWALASGDVRFGGISAIHVEGGAVTALSDVGMMMRFALPRAGGTAPIRFDPLVEGPGPRTRKSSRDSEAMLIEGARLWVSYERHNMVWRYDRASLGALASAQPAPMRRWRGNSGPEALVRLADGRFLLLAEGRDDGNPFSDALLFAGDPALPGTPAARLRYRRQDGYRATDAALLPDGRILILNRRFAWLRFSARLVVADTAGLAEGGTIEGAEVATLEAPLTVDNMEALSVTIENGRTIVWLASDDNFTPMQRTLLLKFELIG